MSKKTIKTKPLSRNFEIRKDTLKTDSNVIDIIFSTGAKVQRSPWYADEYNEELSLDPAHIRLDRMNNSAPFLNTHRSQDLSDVLGVIVKGSAKTDGKVGTAQVRFSDRDDVQPILSDVKSEILTHVSVGYRVYTYRDVTQPGDSISTFLAIDWEPFEVSLVPIGADDQATTRAQTYEQHACEIIQEDKSMPPEVVNETKKVEVDSVKIEDAKREAAQAETNRVTEIMAACRKAGLDGEKDFVTKLIADKVSLDGARAEIINKLSEKSEKTTVRAQHVTLGENIEKRAFVDGASSAILHRGKPDLFKVEESGARFVRMKLMDMLRFQAEKILGRDPWTLNPEELVRSGFHTTSDFPEILANVANKSLAKGYAYAPQTFTPFVKKVPRQDFRDVKVVNFGEAPTLDVVVQGAEFKYGTIAESSEVYALLTYGKKVKVTRQVIINDDLNAIVELPYKFGVQGNILESNLVYAQITGNPTMSDTFALFHANHNNLSTSGVPPDVGSIDEATTAIRLQKGLDGVSDLNLEPKYILTPVVLATRTSQYVTQLQGQTLAASEPANTNPFVGKLIQISDPRLDRASTTAWYTLGDKNQCDIIELGYLEGQENGLVLTQEEITGEGVVFQAYMDRAAKILDWRNIYKNPGV